ncbi:poly(U)-binding-splicing factor PUF60-like isoform X1 [Bolinopsis microptera]|uniref:poly(U)-binding-splicing factor PUF60-like isoform X1 n=1 Tax=Bolinopsis microptera TaxID=2820187 RepID=UPI00307AF138
MPRYRSRSKSPIQRIRKKGNLTIIEGMYQPTIEEDKKLYEKYKKWISEVEQTAAPPLRHLTLPETELLHKAKKFAMECSVQAVLTKKPIDVYSNMTEEQRQQQRDRAVSLMCRVYVGSIHYDLTEDDLRKAFAPFGPIKGINLSWDTATLGKSRSHKGYAFLEYNVAESAQLALDQMNGVMLGGKPLKCARPSNIPAALPLIKQITEEASTQPRIFVASIHQDLSETDIRSVFEAFGPIQAIQLSQDVMPGKHQGYGFIEYENLDSANDAVAAMNLFDLGGQFLRVGRAITPPQQMAQPEPVPPEIAAAAAAAAAASRAIAAQDEVVATSRSQGQSHGHGGHSRPHDNSHSNSRKKHRHGSRERSSRRSRSRERGSKKDKKKKREKEGKKETEEATNEDEDEGLNAKEKAKKTIEGLKGDISISQEEEMSITGSNARFMIMQKLAMKDKESTVMILKNMVAFEDVDDELEGEVKEECGKHGKVKKVVVYQEAQSEADDAEVFVKIFVQFYKSSECEVAINALNGRWFGGRTIDAQQYEEQRFLRDDLSG